MKEVEDLYKNTDNDEQDTEITEQSPEAARKIILDPDGPDIDWQELEGAFENNSPEVTSFMNIATGEVRRIVQGLDDEDESMLALENDPNFLYVGPISSREQYRWMEEFIQTIQDTALKEKLRIAIDGKGAFRRFKDVLFNHTDEKDNWFVKRSHEIRTHIIAWLRINNIRPCEYPPWLTETGKIEDSVSLAPRTKQKGSSGSLGNLSPGDLRRRAHQAVEALSHRDLYHALSYLEFLRLHRLGEFSKSGGPPQAVDNDPLPDHSGD